MLIFGRRNDATKKLLANLVNRFLSVHLVQMRGEDIHSFWGKDVMLLKDFFSFLLTYPSMCQFVSLFVFVFIFDPSPCCFIPSSHWSSGRLKITHLQPSWPLLRPGPARRQAGGGSCPAASSESPRHTASSIAAVCGPEMWLPHP